MKKKTALLLVSILLSITLLQGCFLDKTAPKSEPSEPPDISISISAQSIPYEIGKNQWNGAIYDRADTFQVILKSGAETNLPYIKLGKTAVIDFKGYPPDTIRISDYVLNEQGNNRYTEKEIILVSPETNQDKASFEIAMHPAALLSSNSKDYEKGAVYRGFRIICSWGDNECEYAFIIKTDAS